MARVYKRDKKGRFASGGRRSISGTGVKKRALSVMTQKTVRTYVGKDKARPRDRRVGSFGRIMTSRADNRRSIYVNIAKAKRTKTLRRTRRK
jgi:hypothetical protein